MISGRIAECTQKQIQSLYNELQISLSILLTVYILDFPYFFSMHNFTSRLILCNNNKLNNNNNNINNKHKSCKSYLQIWHYKLLYLGSVNFKSLSMEQGSDHRIVYSSGWFNSFEPLSYLTLDLPPSGVVGVAGCCRGSRALSLSKAAA